MKKVLLSSAIAATMSVPAFVSAPVFADISIKGDAQFRYASREDLNDVDVNQTDQRLRLHFTGKAGDTTAKIGFRNDGGTRISDGRYGSISSSPNGDNIAAINRRSGEGRGIATGNDGRTDENSSQLNTDYFFITTKIGPVDIKVGDWWDTTGFGLIRKGASNAKAIELSTKYNGWRFGIETKADSGLLRYAVGGKINGWKIDIEHLSTSASASDTMNNTAITPENPDGRDPDADHTLPEYTDIAIKGKIAGIGVAIEYATSDARGNGATSDGDAHLVHIWKTISGITWHFAYANWDQGIVGFYGNGPGGDNVKFSPLGVSILGFAPGAANGVSALGDVNANRFPGGVTDDQDVWGIRADFKVAGMGVQTTVGNLDLGINHPALNGGDDLDGAFKDIIITRNLGKGSNVKLSYGDFEDGESLGVKFSVKF